ncbi:hypothetical protein SAMN05443633_105218 [Chryseobacterium arachidis]|uniref:Uncharacterized protein n=2 Tax=Chryseobacterium arachidis TaxID=1416778 RepID=A0A1M5DA20_9FLAO|nr:hypothetical protein SAMN05443633_105218 [Chryseobacterium arachidis]
MQLNNFVVTIFGFKSDDLKSLVELIKKYYLNKQTVLLEEDNCIEILSGDIDESPDWGDWSTFFAPFDFEKYETNFTKKK